MRWNAAPLSVPAPYSTYGDRTLRAAKLKRAERAGTASARPSGPGRRALPRPKPRAETASAARERADPGLASDSASWPGTWPG